jgi:histidinol dehydrogenase
MIFCDGIENAGSVFIGITRLKVEIMLLDNHTLPTNGYAKNYSGVNLIVLQNR